MQGSSSQVLQLQGVSTAAAPQTPSSPRLMLISPSSRFNSRRILASLNGNAAQQAAADAGPALPGTEGSGVEALAALQGSGGADALAAAGMFRGASSSSSGSGSAGWSLRTQKSFAMSGEVIADAADEETAGTAAPMPAALCSTDSTAHLHSGVGSLHLAGLGSAAGAAAAAIAAAVAQAQAAAANAASVASPAPAAAPSTAAGRFAGPPSGLLPHSSVPTSPSSYRHLRRQAGRQQQPGAPAVQVPASHPLMHL
ncbi:hypothetical protein COO60DRAFT_774357 [Scenedesmus sp. NREL 46B-D3]|nr:hypothetical protein COO60DRAFT_774357 [Scenedesmus sp. NREL 46B-D3]